MASLAEQWESITDDGYATYGEVTVGTNGRGITCDYESPSQESADASIQLQVAFVDSVAEGDANLSEFGLSPVGSDGGGPGGDANGGLGGSYTYYDGGGSVAEVQVGKRALSASVFDYADSRTREQSAENSNRILRIAAVLPFDSVTAEGSSG